MGKIFTDVDLLTEEPNFYANDCESLPIDIWYSTNMGDHNELRIKFYDNNRQQIPLRISPKGIKLPNNIKIKNLKIDSRKQLYDLFDWFIATRDIFCSYSTCENVTPEYSRKAKELLYQRDEEFSKNKQKFKVSYTILPTDNGCQFVTPIQIPYNVELEKMSAKINEQFEEVDKFSDELMGIR